MNLTGASCSRVLDLFTVKQTAKIAGLSVSMVNYLCRVGIAVPSQPRNAGRGRRRRYTFGEIVFLRAVARLLEAGVSVKRLKESFGDLNAKLRKIGPVPAVMGHLVTDGKRIYHQETSIKIEDLTSGQKCFAFLIELGPIQKEVAKEIQLLKSSA
jgi:DNA-binding transcriptional MerR regulator